MASSQARAVSLLAAAKKRTADDTAPGSTAALGTTATELYQEAKDLGLKVSPFTSVNGPSAPYGQTITGGDGYPVSPVSPNYDREYSAASSMRQNDERVYMDSIRDLIEGRRIENEMARVARRAEQAEWDANYLKRTQTATDRALRARGSSSGGTTGSLISQDALRALIGG